MARTLVISDMHIGSYAGHCVLEREPALTALVRALATVDRLVIAGDLLELGEGRPVPEVLEIAAPILSALSRAVAEIVLIPGNHDRRLVYPWIQSRGTALGLDELVAPDASPVLASVVALLASEGAAVQVHYPGYRLSERVWITHGHYLDRALAPQGPYGFLRRPTSALPADYERRRPQPRSRRRPSTIRFIQRRLLRPRFARFTTASLNWQMRRHSMPALARVLEALGLSAEFVIFGHVHRLGPLAGDQTSDWEFTLGADGTLTRFLNTGAWVEEELLIGNGRTPGPYWPGGAVLIEDDGVPRAVELLAAL